VSMAVVDGDPLVVNLKPLGIAGQWQVDEDGVWRESGEILEVLPGEHIVSFSDVRGYLTPKPVTVIVAAGIAKTITGTYRPADTLLTVTLTPPAAVSRGAKWNVDNGAWKDSGTTVTLKTGTHTVRFKDIDGFETPKLQTVKIKQGQNATVTGEYPWNGSIKVTILPAAVVKKGAKWCVDGGAWQNSGKSVTVKAGAHVLSFKAVSGYATPEDRQVDVPAGEDITESVTYPPVGKLKVTILPAAVISKGAMWKVEGGAWQQSGKVLELAPGTYKVSFKNVTDYITPEPLSAKVHANTLTAKTGTYEQCGSLTVRITPPDAVKKGARWAVDGGAWQNSGAVVKNLAPGEHTVTFKAATGYKTPTQKSANIVSGKKTTVKVEYKK